MSEYAKATYKEKNSPEYNADTNFAHIIHPFDILICLNRNESVIVFALQNRIMQESKGIKMVVLKENILDVNTYKALRKSVNWKKLNEKQMETALRNSLLTICAYIKDKPVGMGRLVGDGVVICYIQELIIMPDYQRLGVGDQIMCRLIEYTGELRLENTEMMLGIMCAKGREEFYKKYGFIERPTDTLGPGMIMYLK